VRGAASVDEAKGRPYRDRADNLGRDVDNPGARRMLAVPYTEAFKAQMVRRMLGPPTRSATSLAKEVGVSQTQLWRWRKKALSGVAKVRDDRMKKAEGTTWTPLEKLRLLGKADGLEGDALGAFLRREGIHEDQLRAWRDAASEALSAEAAPPGQTRAEERRANAEAKKRIKELERELRRKEKALAEAAALLMLEKKLQALGWGSEGGGTGERNDE
jgi:transposase